MLIETESISSSERSEINSVTKRIFISADHGMAIIYFLQSDVVIRLYLRPHGIFVIEIVI